MPQIYKASKLAFSDINRNWRLGLSPCTGVATGLLKTPRTQLEKQAKMTQQWSLSETHSKSQLFHILNTKVTRLNTHSTKSLDTEPKCKDTTKHSNWQVVCKDANCVASAEIKYSYLVLPMQKQKHNWNLSVKYLILRKNSAKFHYLDQGFWNGALGPPWGPRSGSLGATSRGLH